MWRGRGGLGSCPRKCDGWFDYDSDGAYFDFALCVQLGLLLLLLARSMNDVRCCVSLVFFGRPASRSRMGIQDVDICRFDDDEGGGVLDTHYFPVLVLVQFVYPSFLATLYEALVVIIHNVKLK
jgi:hypothetical protein